ncbi:MAG: hypothetical protein OXU77_02465 [Gammaproteobacteria bacterium]|nr:hypothetical protein [Gammaproteobacteria bacterium]MDE0444551.1 hypothetical protein [Gammaproteobacteria bacterium]
MIGASEDGLRDAEGELAECIAQWTRARGSSPRQYPASLVWCFRRPGRDLRDRVESWLAWRRVERESREGLLGPEYDEDARREIASGVMDAADAAKDEVWGAYRFVGLADAMAEYGLRLIDLGAGHSSSSDTLGSRVVTALKTEALVSESVGAGYVDRHSPPAFRESGVWSLTSLRQSFLDGSLTGLLDPDAALRSKVVEFVANGDFGLASNALPDGGYERLWHAEPVAIEEVALEPGVVLLTKGPEPAASGTGRARTPAAPSRRLGT